MQESLDASVATAPTFTPGAAAHNTQAELSAGGGNQQTTQPPAANAPAPGPSNGAAQPEQPEPIGCPLTVDDCGIRDVCADNLEEEFALMCNVMDEYPYVSIDTEFPGIVLEPFAENIDSISTWNYAQLRDNVNALKLIQLGISFSNAEGEAAPSGPCWQFNFQFDLGQDMYASDAIDLLTNSQLDFERTREQGIKPETFGEMLMSSGLVLNENIHWISFHGLYDFGYILKVLTSSPLPPDPEGYFEALSLFFPKRCDIKYLLREETRGGLSHLGERLGCRRRGQSHQGGSDALLTADIFHALAKDVKAKAFDDCQDDCGGLFGLSNEERHAYHPFFNKQQQQAEERQAREAAAAHASQYTSPPRDERPYGYPQQMPYQGNVSPMYSHGPVQNGQEGMYLGGYGQVPQQVPHSQQYPFNPAIWGDQHGHQHQVWGVDPNQQNQYMLPNPHMQNMNNQNMNNQNMNNQNPQMQNGVVNGQGQQMWRQQQPNGQVPPVPQQYDDGSGMNGRDRQGVMVTS